MVIPKHIKKMLMVIQVFFICFLLIYNYNTLATELHPTWLKTELDKADKLNDKLNDKDS